jgi:hypothetical protein
MHISESKTQLLMLYKTLLDQNKVQLLEMSLEHDAMIIDLPDVIAGDLYVQLNIYLKHLRTTLNACEAVRKAIDKQLTELE